MLVLNADHGRYLAAALNAEAVALMRGHGFAAVGEHVADAVFRAIYTEFNARLQREAISLGGKVTYLDPGEAELADRVLDVMVGKPWDLWKKKALERMRRESR